MDSYPGLNEKIDCDSLASAFSTTIDPTEDIIGMSQEMDNMTDTTE